MSVVNEISESVQKGRAEDVKALVARALEEGMDPKVILNEGLLDGIMIIGAKFRLNGVFVPEVLFAGKAMNEGLSVLECGPAGAGNEPIGRVVVGTVQGDFHDIGKNLVTMMMKGAGLEVYDVGVDADAEAFIDKAEEVGADIIAMSALLTTTMPNMQTVINELKAKGLRDRYIVMIGGAPVTQDFADQIGADYYTADAASAAEIARQAVLNKKSASTQL